MQKHIQRKVDGERTIYCKALKAYPQPCDIQIKESTYVLSENAK